MNTIGDKIARISKTVYKQILSKDNETDGSGACEDGESLGASVLRRGGERAACSRAARLDEDGSAAQLRHLRPYLAYSRPSLWDRFHWVGYMLACIVLWVFFRRYIVFLVPEGAADSIIS